MPKVALTINDFSGGLITDVSPRDLEPNQLEFCTNVDPSRKGRMFNSRIFKDADTDVQGGDNDFTSAAHATPGYGLFVFSNDNEIQSGHAANADDFLVKADGATVDFQELSDGTVTANQIGATATTPAFYAAEGDIFCGGDHSTAPRSLVWHYQAKRDRIVADWLTTTQTKTAPTEGVGGDMLIHASDDDDASGNTDFTSNEVDKLHWVLDFGADESGGFNNKSDGATAGTYMEFAASWLYKNKAESNITVLKDGSNGSNAMDWQHANADVINGTLTVHVEVGAAYSAGSDHIYGARLYSRKHLENTWYLLAEVDFEKGIKGDLETEFSPWADSAESYGHAAESAGAMATTNTIVDPPGTLTFKTLNGYDYDDIVGTVYFKHATVANSRAYVGNVKVNGRVYGDRVLKSPIFQYDVFTENAFIDVAINDGDQITALEAYADRLLEFKKKSLYIINISKELEFLEDVRVGAGIDNPASVTKTPFGVVWANQTGCFLYDGEQITQLSMGKISDTEWNENITANVIVGYDLPSRQIVILWNGATAGDGDAYVYTLDTQSWHLVNDMMFHAANVTNMVNTSDGELLIGGGVASGGATQGEVSVYAARGAASTIDMRTGQLSMGSPGNKKNLINVKVRYKYGGNDLTVSIITNKDSDDTTETTTPLTVNTDSGEDTDYLSEDDVATIHTREFNTLGIAALQNQYWFQVKIAGTAHQSFELDEIVLTYRDLGTR